MTPNESNIVHKLIDLALDANYTISVFDGEEYPVKRSTCKSTVLDALGSTECDTLVFRKPEQLARDAPVGQVLLIWGNDRELISDHSDNELTNALVARTEMEWAR